MTTPNHSTDDPRDPHPCSTDDESDDPVSREAADDLGTEPGAQEPPD